MRYATLLQAFVALWLCNGLVLSLAVISPRQDGGTPTGISIPSPTTPGNAASSTASLTRSQTRGSTATGTASGRAPASSSSSGRNPAPTTSGGLASSNNTSSEQAIYQGGLPITPKITPGVGVAGVVLLLTGLPYCLIGIKIKFLHIFLSTAFLCSLGVTVLIVYVMNPPVKDAIQGAYVTAVTITGLLTGGLAIVFPEVTEALGCLLGGFCVSMWFLVLKPGGLVTSVYGKLILIASFCLVIFSLAFHRLTRPYALIFSISFSGATTIVLGMDCFSRAGLKEFWLYIWALNNNMFPLETNTYPHTRGIRVEICVIVLITAFGIMSQVKLWKILKERRAQKDLEKRQQEADLEALDEDAGRRVEEEQKVERAQWEAAYGAKDKETSADEQPIGGCASRADSGIGDDSTAGKKSGESTENSKETDDMKREEHSQSAEAEGSGDGAGSSEECNKEQQDSGMEINVIPVGTDEFKEERLPPDPKEGGYLAPEAPANRLSSQTGQTVYHDPPSRPGSRRGSTGSIPNPEYNVKRFDVPPPPKVIPLPVPIPTETEDDDEVSSLATFADSVRGPIPQDLAEMRPTVRVVQEEEEDEEQEEDKASSLVVTCDDGPDAEYQDLGSSDKGSEKALSTATSPNVMREPGETPLAEEVVVVKSALGPDVLTNKKTFEEIHDSESEKRKKVAVESTPSDDSKNPSNRSSQEIAEKPPVTSDHSKNDASAAATDGPADSRDATSSLTTSKSPSVPMKLPDNLAPASSPDPNASASSSAAGSYSSQLQVKCSKVVRNYRTNEWAKHLSEADAPELEKLEDNIYTINSTVKEVPVPVRVEELQETAEIPSQPPSRPVSKLALYESHPTITPPPGNGPLQVTKTRHSQRNSISPTSPKERAISPVDRAVSPTGRTTPLPFGQNTLIGKRESMVRGRPSFNTYSEYPPAPSPIPGVSPSDLNHRASFNGLGQYSQNNSLSRQSSTNDEQRLYMSPSPVLDDDMPLSARRTELLQHSASQKSNSQGPQSPRWSLSQQPDNKREALMKSWRESIKTDQQTNLQATHAISERRGEMINERQQALKKHLKDSFKDEVMEERMRQRNMQLHTEALRKMQATANRHVNGGGNAGA